MLSPAMYKEVYQYAVRFLGAVERIAKAMEERNRMDAERDKKTNDAIEKALPAILSMLGVPGYLQKQ